MPHWEELTAAIVRTGVGDLVATTGEDLIERLELDAKEGHTTAERYDPLMGAHNLILGVAIERDGLSIFSENEDGSEICPLCHCAGPYASNWIRNAAAESAAYAANLVKPCETTSEDYQEPQPEGATPA